MKDNQINNQDLSDWVDALENLLLFEGKEATKDIIRNFIKHANSKGLIDDIHFSLPLRTLYLNMQRKTILETGKLKRP